MVTGINKQSLSGMIQVGAGIDLNVFVRGEGWGKRGKAGDGIDRFQDNAILWRKVELTSIDLRVKISHLLS